MTVYQALDYALTDGVATVTMNQPKARNPLSVALKEDFSRLFPILKSDGDVRVVILRGQDGVFCGGGDLKFLDGTDRTTVEDRDRIWELHDWFQILVNMEKPVIAAVDGAAYGGGFGLALGKDFILLSDRARLCSVFSRIGLVPDVGVIFSLPRVVGLQRAKEIAMTGRPVFAEEAKQLGIAMEVYPADSLYAEADKLARRLALSSTKAQGMTKRAMNQSFTMDAAAAVEVEALMQSVLFQSDYHKDAINRFVNKKPLKFNWEDMTND